VSRAEVTAAELTVVIPAHNAAATLAEAIGSLTRTHDPAPSVIVIDDRSDDDTSAVAAAHGAIVRPASGSGPGAARNTGVRLVDTEYLAFLDADDWWHPDRLHEHLDRLSDPSVDLVLGRTQYRLDDAVDPATASELLVGHRFQSDDATVVLPHFGAATMRTAAFHRAGWIDDTLANYEDYEWFYRARDLGIAMYTSDRIAQIRRITAGSTSRLNPPGPTDLLAVMQRSVRRRRALGLPGDASTISTLGR
jgi:glycosyltransferase involved in cell wall biosynthesis